ncbi:MAG: glycosyltransferase family 2 protein [Athalassotoga sp.]
MLSLICVYNNNEILEKYLLSSLKEQTVSYDLILVDNTKNEFKSAAEALNFGASKARGDYFVFLHQDISFISPESLEQLEKVLQKLPQKFVAGPAGAIQASTRDNRVVTNIKHGNPPVYAGGKNGLKIKDPYKAQTLDECMMVIPKEVFDVLKFDKDTCSGWHLYVVDYCISALKMDIPTYVIPVDVYHRSSGNSMNKEYYRILQKVTNKHKSSVDYLYTTMGAWPTSPLSLKIKLAKISTKEFIKKFINSFSIGRRLLEFRRNLKQKNRG